MEDIKKFEPLFGEWYADKRIGAGSFGKVYRIKKESLGHVEYSALKYISVPDNDEETERLSQDGMDEESILTYYSELVKEINAENLIMSQLKGNTNIVSYETSSVKKKEDKVGYDIFIKMELLQSLPKLLKEKPLSRNDLIKLGIDMCKALELCEKRNIIHRDIKPDNIFINDNGDFKLGDFGIARVMDEQSFAMSKKGTYNYMAPEVYKGKQYTASVDLYSLGLVMYKLANAGRSAFLPQYPHKILPGDRDEALVRRMQGEKIPLPSGVDEELGNIILKACEFEPWNRFRSPEEMRLKLEDLARLDVPQSSIPYGRNTFDFSPTYNGSHSNSSANSYYASSNGYSYSSGNSYFNNSETPNNMYADNSESDIGLQYVTPQAQPSQHNGIQKINIVPQNSGIQTDTPQIRFNNPLENHPINAIQSVDKLNGDDNKKKVGLIIGVVAIIAVAMASASLIFFTKPSGKKSTDNETPIEVDSYQLDPNESINPYSKPYLTESDMSDSTESAEEASIEPTASIKPTSSPKVTQSPQPTASPKASPKVSPKASSKPNQSTKPTTSSQPATPKPVQSQPTPTPAKQTLSEEWKEGKPQDADRRKAQENGYKIEEGYHYKKMSLKTTESPTLSGYTLYNEKELWEKSSIGYASPSEAEQKIEQLKRDHPNARYKREQSTTDNLWYVYVYTKTVYSFYKWDDWKYSTSLPTAPNGGYISGNKINGKLSTLEYKDAWHYVK